jgi:gliding motility-associated-like protein
MSTLSTTLKNLIVFFIFSFLIFNGSLKGQSCVPTCSAVTSFTANLSSNPNNTYTVSSVRNGKCCHGVGSDACVVFYVSVHPSATEIKFFKSGGNNGTYQINCMAPTYNPTDPVCLNGLTNFCLIYCNPGNNNDTYTITTSSGFSATPNMTLSSGCTGTMAVSGLNPNSITWTSITGSVQGQYNSFLSCTSGSNCVTTSVTPGPGAPAFIDYKVCGTKAGCASGSVCDTVRVTITSGLTVAITPTNPVVCSGGSGTVALTASVTGGGPPYSYTWSPGPVNTQTVAAGVGTYTVSVNDVAATCPAVTKTITVAAQTTPTTPAAGANTPLCAGQTLSLTATASGTTYNWTGPNSFTSTAQNPTIAATTTAATGMYSVTSSANGCTSAVGTISVTVNPAPVTPTVGANSPLCALQTLSLSAQSISGASYTWSGPNSFSSSSQNPTIAGVSTAASGTYSVFATVAGCPGGMGTVAVTVNPAPATPTVGSNSPICALQTLSLSAQTLPGTYTWSGPNSFSSSSQNPTIPNASTLATGTYSVFVTSAGCSGAAGTVAVVVNPAAPTPTVGANTPLCAGSALNFTAQTIASASYSWTGPNSFSSSLQNPTIGVSTTAASGTYSVFATVAGCPGAAGTVAVVVNPIPATPTVSSNSPVCAGSTITFTAQTFAGATYSWTGPASFSSSSQNPSIPNATLTNNGTYSVTTTISGCKSTAGTVAVTVNPIPVSPTVTSNSPICAGSTLSFTAQTIASASYTWTGPNGFSSSSQNPNIGGATTAATGVYSVFATVAGCAGPTRTISAVVNPAAATPSPFANSPLCALQTLSLNAGPPIAGATYSWTGPNSFSSSAANPTIAGVTTAASGTYSVFATVAGCPGSTGTVAVTVNPAPATPTVASNSPVCAGSTLSFSAQTIGGATYSWSGPNSFSSSLQNPTIGGATTAATGTYSVFATVAGCPGASGTVAVTVISIPSTPTVTSNSPVCAGSALTFSAQPIAGATYSWTGPNSFTSAVQNPTITNASTAASGTYSVFVTASGCPGGTGTVAVTVNPIPATPTVSANSPLCAGQTLNLQSQTFAGATYSWTGPASFSSTLQNPSITNATLTNSGTYSVTTTLLGCKSLPGTVSVTVNPIPVTPTASATSPICAGQTLSLTAQTVAGASYTWSGPNSFSSSSQNPTIGGASTAASGTYSVFVTVAGCSGNSGTASATVNPIPATPTVTSNSPICSGQALTFTAQTIASATYSWTGPNSFSSTLQNPTIATAGTVASGIYSVVATVSGCSNPTAGTVAVTVNQTPIAPTASGTATLCVGSTITLSATTVAGATSYTWTGPNGFTANTQNTSIPGASTLATGMYSVSAISAAGCKGPAGTFSVSVLGNPPTPTLTANSPLCSGQTLSLTAQTILGASYNWSGPNSFSSSLQNPTLANVTTAAAGTYSVFVNVSGCGSTAATVALTVNSTPAAPTATANTPLCVGQNINLGASSTGATYSWTGPNSFTSTSQNPTITGATTLATGMYSVVATSAAGCIGSAGTVSVTVNPIPAAPTATANSPICAGQNLNLGASTTGTSFSWTGPNSFASAVQNPTITNAGLAASGQYSVAATALGCTSSAGVVNVTVNPIPVTPTATANSPICSGQTLNLSATFTGVATYSWTGPNSFSSTNQNPSITNAGTVAAGVYSVVATVAGCSNPLPGTVAVTVNQTPNAPVAGGTATLCVGATITLTASTISGATYSWTGPNSFNASTQNTTIPGATSAATGLYSVTATSGAGCTGPAGTFSVSVISNPPTPTLSANSPLCVGQTLSLTAQTILGASYNWAGPNSFSSGLQNPTLASITSSGAGTYSVFVNASGCGSAAATIAVVVNATPPAPTATVNTPICDGQNLNFGATGTGVSYNWTGPNSFTSGSQNPTITGATTLATGAYSVTTTSALGCVSPAGIVNATVNPIPAAPTATANSPICEGQNLFLGASTTGTSFSWTGPNSFNSSVQNPTIVTAGTVAAGDYSVTATALGCTSPAGVISVTINPTPSAPVASNNSPICAFQTLSLTASPITGATYSWTGPNTFTSTTQDPTIIGATTLAAGVYTVVAIVSGCPSAGAITSVTINVSPNAPIPNSNSPVCVGQTISLNSSTITGASYNWSGPDSFTSTTQNPTIPGATTLATGVYSITATVAGCTSTVGTVSVTVTSPAIVSAGSAQTVCANNGTTTLNGSSSTGSGVWTSSGTGTFVPNNTTLNASYVPSAADNSAGTVTLTLTSSNNGPCSAVTDQIVLNITPAPTANAGANQTLCANNATVTLNGSFTVGTGGIWSTAGTGTFSPNNTAMNASYAPSAADISAGSVIFTLTTTGNGNCLAASDTMKLNFSPAPTISAGTATQVVCKNNPNYALNATSTTGSVTWATLGTGSFSPNNNVLNPTYMSSTADTTAGSVNLVITTTNNGGCNPVSTTITLVYISTITVNAGPTQTVCANNASISLSGTSATGSGTWSTSGSGSFSPNSLTGNYLPSAGDISAGVVTLTLTSTNNGGCNPVFSVTSITINPGPTVNAGTSQTVCANNATVSLNGTVTLATGGSWTSSGTGTFSPSSTTLSTNYIPSSADTTAGSVNIFLTTTGNGNCLASTDTVNVQFTPAPIANAGGNIFVCKNNPVAVLNGYSSTGSGIWSTSGTGTLSPNNTALSPTYTPSSADTTAGVVTFIFTSSGNGNCNPVSDTVTINYSAIPTVFAGVSQTVCSNNSAIVLTGTASTGAGTWTSSGTGTFAPNALSGTYTPSSADISAGSITLTLTTTNNGGCAAVTSQMTVDISPSPTSASGADQTVCSNNATISLSGSVTIASGGAWSSSGTGTFSPNNTSMNTSYLPSSADTTAGSVMIFLTTTGNGNCNAVVDTMMINFTPAPLVNAGANFSVCKSNLSIPLSGYVSTGTGTWTTVGTGSFSPSGSVLNPTYTATSADTTAGSVTFVLTSENNGACNAVSDTIVVNFGGANMVTAGTSQTVCANNSSVTLAGFSSTGSGTWTASGTGLFAPNTPTGTYVPSAADISAGTVTLTLTSTNNGGCLAASDQLTVNIGPAPTAIAGSAQTVCANNATIALNGSVTIATGGLWSSSGTGTFVSTNSLVSGYMASQADTTAGSVYIYLTTTGNGSCNQVVDSMQLSFAPAPLVNAGSNQVLCSNAISTQLNGTSSTGTATWTTLGSGAFSPNGGILNPSYTPSAADTSAGSVTLVLTSENNGGCNAVTDTMTISFQGRPYANFSYSGKCLNSAVTFTDMSTVSSGTIISWMWYFGNDTSATQHPSNTFTATGSQTVSLVVSNGGCQDSLAKTIFINPSPVADYSFSVLCNDSVQFQDLSQVATGNINSWNWDFGDLNTSSIQHPIHVYADTGTYYVSLAIASDSGCVSQYLDTVSVTPCDSEPSVVGTPTVPSIFTPNGDGKNDVLYVKGGPFQRLDFKVFNEWGNMIFESTIQSSGWDGTFKSALQPVGRYIWTVDGETIDGRTIKKAGEVLLSR